MADDATDPAVAQSRRYASLAQDDSYRGRRMRKDRREKWRRYGKRLGEIAGEEYDTSEGYARAGQALDQSAPRRKAQRDEKRSR